MAASSMFGATRPLTASALGGGDAVPAFDGGRWTNAGMGEADEAAMVATPTLATRNSVSGNTRTTFMSRKPSKVRWLQGGDAGRSSEALLVVASWDEPVNVLELWAVPTAGEDDPGRPEMVASTPSSAAGYSGNNGGDEEEHRIVGSVTGLAVTGDKVVVGTTGGAVEVWSVAGSTETGGPYSLDRLAANATAHTGAVNNVAVAPDATAFASVGEDSALNIFDINDVGGSPLLTLPNAHSASVNDVAYVSRNEIVTVGSASQLRMWDLRASDLRPTAVLKDGPNVFLHSVDAHPNQPHFVAAGASSGALSIWDTRETRWPLVQAAAHVGNVWEVMFHPTAPDFVLTASADATVLMWNFGGSSALSKASFGSTDVDPVITRPVEVESDVTTIDVLRNGNMLACGADNMSLTLCSNLVSTKNW